MFEARCENRRGAENNVNLQTFDPKFYSPAVNKIAVDVVKRTVHLTQKGNKRSIDVLKPRANKSQWQRSAIRTALCCVQLNLRKNAGSVTITAQG